MNVVHNQTRFGMKQLQPKKELVRKDAGLGIRGLLNLPTVKTLSSAAGTSRGSSVPRYQFGSDGQKNKSSRNSMGPPLEPPRGLKRKLPASYSTSSGHIESGSRGRVHILASDSGAQDTSHDFSTPKNRPSALRYISSSSRGGYSGNRSARSTSASVVEPSVLLAISEGRGMARGEIGMAAIDLRHPTLVLCQFSDCLLYTHTLTKINYFNPLEIIVPHTFCEGAQPSQLYTLIKDKFPNVIVSTVQRRHYNDAAGLQQIQSLCAPQYNAVYLQVLHKFYALTAAAAVLKYVEYIQCIVFSRESLKIEYHSSENTMIVDVGTATQLELVQPLVPSAGPTCCLLGVLGPTYTVGGIRALRASILQPSCNLTFIQERLDAVQDLIENNELLEGLQNVIKKLSEIDKILFLCVEPQHTNMDKLGEAQLNQTILLKTTMEVVPKLSEALAHANCNRLRTIRMDFENPHYKEISQRIRNVIQDDAHLERGAMGSLQRCFAVKPDISGLLDVARRTYSELIEDIQKLVEQLSESHDLPLRLNQNALRGFHIVLPAQGKRRAIAVDQIPPVFIQVQSTGASITMSTAELVILDQQAKEALSEIQKMSNIVVGGLLTELRPFMSSLYKLCENVAELDILIAMASTSSVGSYVRPEFSNYLHVKNSVHPLLDYNSQALPVANDINASPEYNFTIITGPNMGGKSIFIKQAAIMQIMAQLGCFVPATTAVLRLSDRVFSRIGFNDSVELDASTYVLEMKEIQHILKGITKTSLVIIDELCRGTCTEEGTSIAWAICEELLATEAFIFFTTHFMYLTRLQDLYFNVVNLHTLVTEETLPTQNNHRRLIYKHKIEPGVTAIEHYGLALASKTNLPEDTVKLAEELAELIVRDRKPQVIKSPEKRDDKILYDLNANIRMASRKLKDPDVVIQKMLADFKTNNPNIMRKLQDERNSTKTSVSDDIQHFRSIDNSKTNSKVISSDISTENEPRQLIRVQALVHRSENDHKNIVHRTENTPNNFNNKDNHNSKRQKKHTAVKSSSQLLSTILQSTDIDCEEESPLLNVQNTPKSTFDQSNIYLMKRNILAEDTSTDDNKAKKKSKFRPPLKISDSDSSFNINAEAKSDRNDTIVKSNNKALEFDTLQRILNSTPPNSNNGEICENIRDYEAMQNHNDSNEGQIHENIPPTYEEMQVDKEVGNPMKSSLQNSSQESTQNEYPINLQSDIFQNLQITDSEIHEMLKKDRELAKFNTRDNINSQCSESSWDSQNEQSIDEIVGSDVQNIDKDSDGVNDTNIAEAPTQVLETSSQSDTDIVSTMDQVLIRETLAEINEDIECIVLTPPDDFQDFF